MHMKWSIAVALHSPSLRTLEVLSHRRRLNRCAFGCCSRRSYSTVSFHPQDLSDSSLSLHLQKHTTALHQRETHAKCGTEMKTVSKREGLFVAVNDIHVHRLMLTVPVSYREFSFSKHHSTAGSDNWSKPDLRPALACRNYITTVKAC